MSATDISAADMYRGGQDKIRRELVYKHTDTDYVSDRVKVSDFVKMHSRDRHAMRVAFRVGEELIYSESVRFDTLIYVQARE